MVAATGKAARLAKAPEGRNGVSDEANSLRFGTIPNKLFTIAEPRR